MAPERGPQSRASESRGLRPRGRDLRAAWRTVKAWLAGSREHIDQEGLLAERTLLLTHRRTRRGDADAESEAGAHHREPPRPRSDETV